MLELAVVEYPGKPASQIAQRFARRVSSLSNGSLRVVITYWPARLAPKTPSRQVEASAIRAVRSDDVQIGLIPSHAFQAEGVTTLEALQAPFLITSDSYAARVTTGSVAEQLQAGLSRISLTGLGLVPEGLYRPFGFLKPLVTPADFAGVSIRADSSKATRNLLRTLDAHPVDLEATDSDTSVYSGFVNDAESLPSADDAFPKDAYTAGNIAVFPRVDVVVVSSGALERLRPGQRTILRRAAAEARAETIASAAERSAAAAFCNAGGTITTAPASALRALRAKTRPLLEAMRRDPATSGSIASIERLGLGGGTGVAPCAPKQAEPSTAPDSSNYTPAAYHALLPPDGTYRRAFTFARLRAAGADETEARRNEGVTTLTFYGPRWSLRFVVEWQGRVRLPCRGRVEVTHRRTQLRWNPTTPCSGFIAFSWQRGARGDIRIVALDPRTEPAWIKKAYPGSWKQVDCKPFTGWPLPYDPARSCPGATDLASSVPRGLRGKPIYSPDQKRIVYEVNTEGQDGLFIANADGSGAKWLTQNIARPGQCPCDGNPSFSPTGKRIAFVRTSAAHETALFVVDADGRALRRLTPWSRRVASRVEWSPGGPRLLFSGP